MNPRQTGKYQGAAAAASEAVQAVGPAVVVGIVGAPGIMGWLSLAAVFAAVGMVTPPLAQWAARHRAHAQRRHRPLDIPGVVEQQIDLRTE
jgi:O-antigen ligase